MKKIVALLLVLGMASMANAAVIQIATDPGNGVASQTSHAATAADPMMVGETMMLQIVLNDNDFFTNNLPSYPQYAGYDGYSLLSFDVDITVNSVGELSRKTDLFAGRIRFGGSPSASGVGSDTAGSILADIYAVYGTSGLNGAGGFPQVVYNFKVEAKTAGIMKVDMIRNFSPGGDNPNGYAEYSLDYAELADAFGLEAYQVKYMEATDLLGLELHVIPEPMTIALLGLGGLGMLYRRRRA